jgi:hypothetical protein
VFPTTVALYNGTCVGTLTDCFITQHFLFSYAIKKLYPKSTKHPPPLVRCYTDDHLCTCTAHSGAKKAHDWTVDQFPDLFRTTDKVETQQVVESRGQHCGDIELEGYLSNESDPVSLVLDLRIAHDRFGSSSNPDLNGKLH